MYLHGWGARQADEEVLSPMLLNLVGASWEPRG